MAQYKIIGVEHLEGTSKKTGKPYNMDVLHVADLTSPRITGSVVGNKVDKITVARETGLLTRQPEPGEIYEIGFTRFGFIDYIDKVK